MMIQPLAGQSIRTICQVEGQSIMNFHVVACPSIMTIRQVGQSIMAIWNVVTGGRSEQ